MVSVRGRPVARFASVRRLAASLAVRDGSVRAFAGVAAVASPVGAGITCAVGLRIDAGVDTRVDSSVDAGASDARQAIVAIADAQALPWRAAEARGQDEAQREQ
jgi:hypothetical protein